MVRTHKKPLITIHPGDWYFGDEFERLHTILGSCIAVTVWHPTLHIGGMCHYLLAKPSAASLKTRGDQRDHHNDFRYASVVLTTMKKTMQHYGKMHDYQIGIFGGGDMFAYSSSTSIGADNIAHAHRWLQQEKLHAIQIDVGGNISRSLALVIPTGEIQIKHYVMNQV
jgi:chemotaxis protein CheD